MNALLVRTLIEFNSIGYFGNVRFKLFKIFLDAEPVCLNNCKYNGCKSNYSIL